ncbi:hypothetical protein [Streptomyces sp. NPDC002851]
MSEDPQATAQTLALIAQTEAASADAKVRILQPDWSDEQEQTEVDRIRTESGTTVPDPITGAPSAPLPARQRDEEGQFAA